MQQIPERFIVELDRPLPRICSIENHHGAVWSVFSETIDGKHYFARGWFRFARENALRRGDLLIFTYERHGYFVLKQYWAGTRFPPFDMAGNLYTVQQYELGYETLNSIILWIYVCSMFFFLFLQKLCVWKMMRLLLVPMMMMFETVRT